MSANNVKPAYNAKRRIQFLFGLVVFLIIACTAGWFFVANKIEAASRDVVALQASLGNNIVCDGQDVRGYPFRFGLFCNSVAFESLPQGFAFKAGALRSAAQFYAPRNLIVELDGPATLDRLGFNSWSMNWSQMRARILATEPLPENVSIQSQNAVLRQADNKPIAMADSVELFMRLVDQDLDLAARTTKFEFESLAPQLNALPPLGGDISVRVTDGVDLLLSGQQTLRGVDAELIRLAIQLTEDQGIIVSGPLSIADDGLLNATLNIRIVDVEAVLEVVSNALPDFAPMMTAFANGQPRSGEAGDEIELTVTIDKGQARLGLIPLGTIGPF